ncbi:MAG: HypC/HybG/HupF family hydrogenase formation chaperone [Xanthobacteraceae bacterium]
MCLTVPCEVLRVDGETALVRRGEAQFEVSLLFLDEQVMPGDWLAVQAQRHAQARLSAEEARDILALYARLAGMIDGDGATRA